MMKEKGLAKLFVMFILKKYKCDIKVIRPFNVFGPGMSVKDTRVIPSIVKSIRKNKNIIIFNNGKQTRTFVM